MVGGDQPEYLLMVARESWASYDGFRQGIPELLARNAAALHDFADAVRSADSETWTYHADLSNLP